MKSATTHVLACHARIQMEGTGGPDPHPPKKKIQKIGFLSNTCLDALKITKLSSQNSMVGHHWHASQPPFKCRLAGGPMMARLYLHLDPSSPHNL